MERRMMGKKTLRLVEGGKQGMWIGESMCIWGGEETKQIEGKWNVVYDYQGTVYCICLKNGERRQIAIGGSGESRATLKHRCPAQYDVFAFSSLEKNAA
jgi:hypothetical protein